MHGNGGHFGTAGQLYTKMAVVAVAKLLLCCDIICKCSILAEIVYLQGDS